MASSSTSGAQQDRYPYPSNLNPSGFVSIKLSGRIDYVPWRKQMMCLIESHGMQGFIDGSFKTPGPKDEAAMYEEWKRSDALVQGWMFGSLTEHVMAEVFRPDTAMAVWNELNTIYNTPEVAAPAASTTNKDKDLAEYIPLYQVIKAGDWKKAREYFNKDNNALTAKLNEDGYTALQISVETTENMEFLKNLLKEMDADSLPSMVTVSGNNPLHSAAVVGNTEAVRMLVKKNPRLLFMLDAKEYLPIHRAVFGSHKGTFLYLLAVCKQHIQLSQQEGYHSPFDGRYGTALLNQVINQGFLDVAYKLIKEYPDMARTKHNNMDTPLMFIARKSDLYYSGARYNFYERFVYSYVRIDNTASKTYKVQDIENQETYNEKTVRSCFKTYLLVRRLKEDKVKHHTSLMLLRCICEEVDKTKRHSDMDFHYTKATNDAAENDTSEVIEEMVMHYPQAIWSNRNNYYIIQIAIINRNEKVYNLLVHKMNTDTNMFMHKKLRDKDNNTLLHLAAQLAPIHKLNVVSGAALQMQRELQWFHEVEKFVKQDYKELKNKKQETPMMMFRSEHKELRKEGEEWMKKTADSYTITAALIVTIVFAAAITVPGGNNGDTGKAFYLTRPSFIVFAVSDAISLFTSTTSLLLFLSILTARYRDEDFLYRLPKRLILGLLMLFLSVTALMVAFSATVYIVFGHETRWILIPIAALTCLPITSFVTLQFPLLVELVSSTYGRGIFGKPNDYKMQKLDLSEAINTAKEKKSSKDNYSSFV